MDNSHVALVAVKLEASGFKRYRCDRSIPLGVNLGSLTKVLKCAKDDDILTLKAGDDADILSLTYEAKSACSSPRTRLSCRHSSTHSRHCVLCATSLLARPSIPCLERATPLHTGHVADFVF